jgi:hypothetical protein
VNDITKETNAMAAGAEALMDCTLSSRKPAIRLAQLMLHLYDQLGPAATARVLAYLNAHADEAEDQVQRRREREAAAKQAKAAPAADLEPETPDYDN